MSKESNRIWNMQETVIHIRNGISFPGFEQYKSLNKFYTNKKDKLELI